MLPGKRGANDVGTTVVQKCGGLWYDQNFDTELTQRLAYVGDGCCLASAWASRQQDARNVVLLILVRLEALFKVDPGGQRIK